MFASTMSRLTVPIILTAFYLSLSSVVSALEISASQQFAYAEACFDKGEFQRAADEYQRLIFFFPNAPQAPAAQYKTGVAWFKAGAFEKAVSAFDGFIGQYDEIGEPELWPQAWFMRSACLLRLDRTASALSSLQNLSRLTLALRVRDEALYRGAWMLIESGKFSQAEGFLARIAPANRETYHVEDLTGKMAMRDQIPQKDPFMAGALAIIPGAGHVYCGRYQDAAISFGLNAGLMAAAWEAFDQDLPILGCLIALVDFGFYTGNIYSAVSAAHKANKREEKRFIRELSATTRIDLSAAARGDGLMLVFSHQF